MRFKDIVDHEKTKKILVNCVKNGSTNRAYIFEGPSGVGKFSIAKAFANFLMCSDNFKNEDSCGVCENCKMSFSKHHPDIITVTNDFFNAVESNTGLSIEAVRQMKKNSYLKPANDKKIFIIPVLDHINVQAQNSMLKLFEDAPRYLTIILIVESSKILLKTLVSRCFVIKFGKLSRQALSKYLLENFCQELSELSISNDAEKNAKLISHISDGSLKKATNIIKKKEMFKIRSFVFDLFFSLTLSKNEVSARLALFLEQNKEYVSFFISVVKSILHDILKVKFKIADLSKDLFVFEKASLINIDKTLELTNLSNNINNQVLTKTIDSLACLEKDLNYNMQCGTFIYRFVSDLDVKWRGVV